jgi:predicted RNase H-like HicB family nuclease
MSHIEMNILGEAGDNLPDRLKLSHHEVIGTLRIFTGQQGDYCVSIIPTLNVSGYGENERDAFEALKENLDTFFEDLFQLSEPERNIAMESIGWEMENAFPQKFSNPFVEEQQVLQNFDHPDQVKKLILQTT